MSSAPSLRSPLLSALTPSSPRIASPGLEPRLLARRAFAAAPPPTAAISRSSTVTSASSSFLLNHHAEELLLDAKGAEGHALNATTNARERCGRDLLAMSVPVFVLTIMNAVRGASFGQLLFPPALAPTLARIGGAHAGTSLFLISTALAGISALLRSRLPFASGGASIEMLPMYANICAAVLAHDSLRGSADASALISTTLAAFATSTAIVAMSYAVSSKLGLGSFFRLCPLSVLKGALAGIGIYLLKSAISTASDHPIDTGSDILWLFEGGAACAGLSQAILGLVLGLMLYTIDSRWRSPAAFITFIMGIAVLANLAPALGIVRRADMDRHHWFFSETSPVSGGNSSSNVSTGGASAYASSSNWYSIFTAFSFSAIHWGAVAPTLPSMLGVALTHQLIVVTDLVNIEGVTGVPIDVDHEFSSIGIGNLLAAVSLGIPNYTPVSKAVTGFRIGGTTGTIPRASRQSFRCVGLTVTLATIVLLFVSTALMPCVPRILVACFFTWLGVVFLRETVVEVVSFSPDRVGDSIVVAGMMAAMLVLGFLEGIILGLVLACITATVSQSVEGAKTVIRARSNGAVTQSNVTRPPSRRAWLMANGASNVRILHLQGNLTFGTCRGVVAAVNHLVVQSKTNNENVFYIVLCFKSVTSCDYSASIELAKLRRGAVDSFSPAAESGNGSGAKGGAYRLVYTRCAPHVEKALEKNACLDPPVLGSPRTTTAASFDGVDGGSGGSGGRCCGSFYARHIASFQEALEMCEDLLLREAANRGDVPRKIGEDQIAVLGSRMADADVVLEDFLSRVMGNFMDRVLVRRLMPKLKVRRLCVGEHLWHCGDPGNTFIFIVASGKIHAMLRRVSDAAVGRVEEKFEVSQGHDGTSLLCEVITPGAIVGYLHSLSAPPQPRVTDTVVRSPEGALVYMLPVDVFHTMRQDDPPLAVALLLSMLHRSSEEYTNHVTQQGF